MELENDEVDCICGLSVSLFFVLYRLFIYIFSSMVVSLAATIVTIGSTKFAEDFSSHLLRMILTGAVNV